MTISPYFDPDEILLTKDMISQMITGIITRWKKDEKKHFAQITQLKAFRISLRFQSEESISEVIRQIVLFVNSMQRYNAMLKLKGEMPKTEVLLKMVLAKIDKGEFI